MNIHFNDALFEAITDYPAYTDVNSALIQVRVVKKDETGAEIVADPEDEDRQTGARL